jgi:hypothetical protein
MAIQDVMREVGCPEAWRPGPVDRNAAVRSELKTLRGKEVVTTGDGLLATFGSPAAGVRCATAIREAVRTLGLEIRVGLHAGVAFHIGARVAAKARAGEVLVSSAVKDLMWLCAHYGDGTAVRVRLDLKATSISLLVVLGVRQDGQKVLLAIKQMGGESAEAWRTVLDDLINQPIDLAA